ncbi:hypothetical protein SmJEL517_g02211 [Synchytrium microbalum]|uniref:Rhodanese domain-containing protein n=1 Tax=Synchytrium microbalum TaxID=1806994 RepID=A0A507C2B4_9FUNG|nr:uncharacterized protein SmJEL517_g02211 [Synchytrium microbalum]TPX35267.1 hypothetical protein SmJEL517_g02211 [Synchytrium microbalum]
MLLHRLASTSAPKLLYSTSIRNQILYMNSRAMSNLKSLELNGKQCKTYAIWDPKSKEALLLDPLKESTPLLLSFLAYHGLKLNYVVDTHSHADHITACFKLKTLTGAKYTMSQNAPAPGIDLHVVDGDKLKLGDEVVQVIATPGHTQDCISLYTGSEVFSGDALFVGGCGRTDFAGGDPSQAYDSIMKLFALPDDTILFPGHDYRFNTQSTIGIEKKTNPRAGAGKTREQFVEIMNNLNLPLPDKIMEALQMNTSALEDNQINLPTYPQLAAVRQLAPQELKALITAPGGDKPLVIDVRETSEFMSSGEEAAVPGSINIPVKQLASRISEIENRKRDLIVCVCRVGMRSSTASSILIGMHFENVCSLKGGVLNYNKSM